MPQVPSEDSHIQHLSPTRPMEFTYPSQDQVNKRCRVLQSRLNGEARQQPRTIIEPVHDGARLTFLQLQNAEPRKAAPETQIPTIERVSAVNPIDLRLLDFTGTQRSDALPSIDILNASGRSAYSFIRMISRSGHGKGWGEVWSGVRYTRIQNRTYKAPPPNTFVAIKRLNKRVVDVYLKGRTNATPPEELHEIGAEYISGVLHLGGCENPYREMSRMEQFGDDLHVLRQIEFLQDDEYVYIVMPHACERGSLDHFIFSRTSRMSVTEAQNIFVQIMNILLYLEKHGIHHRDLSPDNFIFLEPDRLVLMDFAMSVRIPIDEQTGQRTLIQAMGMFGTRAFMAPEIYTNFKVFDGVAADLWAAVLILYCMLTGVPLYQEPHAGVDISYRYYVVARGIAQNPINELIVEIMGDVFDSEYGDVSHQHILLDKARANVALTPDALQLFDNVFQVNPAKRWTLAQVLESNFCTRSQE